MSSYREERRKIQLVTDDSRVEAEARFIYNQERFEIMKLKSDALRKEKLKEICERVVRCIVMKEGIELSRETIMSIALAAYEKLFSSMFPIS